MDFKSESNRWICHCYWTIERAHHVNSKKKAQLNRLEYKSLYHQSLQLNLSIQEIRYRPCHIREETIRIQPCEMETLISE